MAGVIFQGPIGYFSDKLDRRKVIVAVTFLSAFFSFVAIILGTQTFGKGSVQTLFPLTKNKLFFSQKEKYGAVKLTTAEYYTPSGKSIQAKGITPDFILNQNKENDSNSDIIQIGETQLNQHIKNKEDVKDKSGSSAYIPKDENKDTQLVEAIKILTDLNKRIIITKRIN